MKKKSEASCLVELEDDARKVELWGERDFRAIMARLGEETRQKVRTKAQDASQNPNQFDETKETGVS